MALLLIITKYLVFNNIIKQALYIYKLIIILNLRKDNSLIYIIIDSNNTIEYIK